VARIPARGALVLVGVALCVFGPGRVVAASGVATAADRAVASTGIAAAATDHAVVERPTASTVADWFEIIGEARAALIAAVLIVVIAAVSDLDRVVLAMVGVPWRRRGPPTRRA
jgi:hypothetical protein